MKKNTKKMAIKIILFLSLLTLSACGYTEEEKIKMEEYKRTAKSNAIAYIKEKYGFTPSVVSAKCATYNSSPVPDFSPGPTGDVYVELSNKKENINFWVYTTGEEKSTQKCWDNYQYEEIGEAVEEQMEALLGVDAEHIDLAYGKFYESGRRIHATDDVDKEYGLIHDYFDGTNLSEILGNAKYNKMVVCTVEDENIPDILGHSVGELTEDGIYVGGLAESSELVQSFGENMECLFINYKDSEAYSSTHGDGCASSAAKYELNSSMEDMYFFIKDQYYITATREGGELLTEYSEYEVKKFDEFYYIAMGGTYCNFAEADEEMDHASQWNGHGFINAKKVYGAYRMESDAKRIYLYVPISSVEANVTEEMEKRSDIRIVNQQQESDGVLDYNTYVTDAVGDWENAGTEKYLTATVYGRDLKEPTIFSVFIEEEKDE